MLFRGYAAGMRIYVCESCAPADDYCLTAAHGCKVNDGGSNSS